MHMSDDRKPLCNDLLTKIDDKPTYVAVRLYDVGAHSYSALCECECECEYLECEYVLYKIAIKYRLSQALKKN